MESTSLKLVSKEALIAATHNRANGQAQQPTTTFIHNCSSMEFGMYLTITLDLKAVVNLVVLIES